MPGTLVVPDGAAHPFFLIQKSPYWGVPTTMDEYGVEGILIVPRQSPNLNYDSDAPATLETWYNANGACSWAYYGTKCRDQPYTYDMIIQRCVCVCVCAAGGAAGLGSCSCWCCD
jgi:hypothetical protein